MILNATGWGKNGINTLLVLSFVCTAINLRLMTRPCSVSSGSAWPITANDASSGILDDYPRSSRVSCPLGIVFQVSTSTCLQNIYYRDALALLWMVGSKHICANTISIRNFSSGLWVCAGVYVLHGTLTGEIVSWRLCGG